LVTNGALTVKMAGLPDGTNHEQQTVLNATAKQTGDYDESE